MFKKSTISNLEHKLLFAASSIFPLLIFGAIIVSVYNSYFPPPPPPPNPSGIFMSNCYTPTKFEIAFSVSLFFCSYLTNILVLRRNIFASWVSLSIPMIFLAIFSYQKITYFYDAIRGIEEYTPPSVFSVFQTYQLTCAAILIPLFLWHTKVIIQDRILDKNLNLNLP